MSAARPRTSAGRSGAAVYDAHVAAAAQLACLLEVSAPKPGNVSPGRHFADARFEDFLASAAALGTPLATLSQRPLGQTLRMAVEATAAWVASNTNLGMVLLLTPLAYAARACLIERDAGLTVDGAALRVRLAGVLQRTTIADAEDAYDAIRTAAPGGLGQSDEEDVRGMPTRPLVEVMRLAQARDDIAHEYATVFSITFEEAVPVLVRARQEHLSWEDAVVETFLAVLARRPDTHIRRRAGAPRAAEVSQWAARAVEAGGVRTERGRRTIEDMDRALRDDGNLANPGTTADLTAAAIYVVLLGGGWR